jgi:hypothetical protein
MHRVFRPGLALPLVAAFAIAPLAARAPGPQAAELPQARTIIDRHIKEIGGRDVILKQSSTRATGTISLPAAGITGKLEAYHAKPNKYLQRMSLPGVGEIEEGFDGTVAWSLSPLTGPTLLDGKQLEQKKFDADFYEDLKPSERFTSMTTVEKTTFEGRPVYKIRLVNKNGDEDFEFYDVETGLKAGGITTRDSPMGAVQATLALTDYKKFGGLMHPSTSKISVMNTQMVMSITTVEYDTVDASVFAIPAQIKALMKPKQ